MFKAGLLTEVHAPNAEQESARELTRCRQTAQENLKRIRHQILKFLTRHGYVYTEGNKRVRRLLIEASWHYRHPYIAGSKRLRERRKGQPQWVIDIADRAGQRLRKRYWYLVNSGKVPCKATVAIARELAGFIWSVFNEYQIRNHEKAA